MGQEIAHWHFSEADHAAFAKRLSEETRLLSSWEKDGRFPLLETSVGHELEACLVDDSFRPADANEVFLERLALPGVVPELARSNIEFNGQPLTLAGDGLRRLHAQIDAGLEQARDVARSLGLRILMIGILPSLREADLNLGHISESNRYAAINRALAKLRGRETVCMQIRGRQALGVLDSREYHGEFDSIMAESAATSFQLHMTLPPGRAAQWYNAALLVSAPLLAVSANAPFLFGHDLWAETRIPVFAQSVDTGHYHYVSFGQGYLNDSMYELFDRNLHHFPPLLPMTLDEPGRPHLKLHNGTIWRWNRAIVDGDDSDERLHYRLEHRSLPSGPSSVDMVANAAFFWGMLAVMQQDRPALTFRQARRNFYRAARDGMAARLLWLDGHEYDCRQLIIDHLLPIARQGLIDLHVDTADIQGYLEVIRHRVARGLSGAGWQRAWLRRHGVDVESMLAAYERNQWSGRPVGEWEI